MEEKPQQHGNLTFIEVVIIQILFLFFIGLGFYIYTEYKFKPWAKDVDAWRKKAAILINHNIDIGKLEKPGDEKK